MKYDENIEPKLKRVSEVFSGYCTQLGLYIPVYQRNYSWSKTEYVRLFNDIVDSMNKEHTTTNSLDNYNHFLGSTIYYDDNDKNYMYPVEDPEHPDKVYNVVDGQQRTTTVVLIATILHNKISRKIGALNHDQIQLNSEKKLSKKLTDLLEILEKYFTLELVESKVPKIIRATDDVWAEDVSNAKYISPIAAFLSQYIDFLGCNIEGGGDFQFSPCNREHKPLAKNIKLLNELVDLFCEQRNDDNKERFDELNLNDLHDLGSLLEKDLKVALFQERSIKINLDSCEPTEQSNLRYIVRAMMLGYYIHNCLLVVRVKVSGDYGRAFTIFDSLNTTGTPLNALESFRPEVIADSKRRNNSKNWQSDPEVSLLNEIDAIIRDAVEAETNKDRVIKDIITISALVINGVKLPGNLANQRSELRDKYLSMKDNDRKQFIELIKSVATIYKVYNIKGSFPLRGELAKISSIVNSDKALRILTSEANFCIDYLKGSSCYLALGIISRYYHHARFATDNIKDNLTTLCKVINAVAAFYAIWRTADQDKQRIDEVFRGVLGLTKMKINASFYDYTLKKFRDLPSLKQLLDLFTKELIDRKKITNMESWLAKIKMLPVYDVSKPSVKFLILVGSHNTIVNNKSDGPIIQVTNNQGGIQTISESSFQDPLYDSIDHILPQSSSDENPSYHELWNLTLLPSVINSIISDSNWIKKKNLYKLCAAKTPEDYQNLINELSVDEKQKSKAEKIGSVIRKHGCLPLIEMLSLTEEFDKEVGNKRMDVLLKNCWNILANQWLEWGEKADETSNIE